MTKRDGLGAMVQRLTQKQAEWALTAEEFGVLCRALCLRFEGRTLTAQDYLVGMSDVRHGVTLLTSLVARGHLLSAEPIDRPDRLISCDPMFATLSKPDDVEVSEDRYSLATLVRATMHLMKPTASGEAKVTERHWKRISEFSKRQESDYTGNDLELLIAARWVEKGWLSQPPAFTAKDYSNAKRFVVQYGPESAARIVNYAITHWEVVAQKIRVNSYPCMSILYGFRNSISPLVLDGDAVSKPSWGSQFNPQTDSRKSGDILGW